MMFDFGLLGRGIVLQHVTPEEPLLQRARFVMYSNLPKLYANFFLLCEAVHVI
uniref:Bm2160, isoform b n=1 Tax=Brugia malayi TaxID=6279 RepID=A0A1I9G752_BRUMA|nr:Bm2160, isoform b [Brugia malayi]